MPSGCGLIALTAAALEGLAVGAALRGAWAAALALHAASCAGAAVWLHRRFLEGPAAWSLALVFGVAFFLPVLGAVGTAILARPGQGAATGREPDVVRTRIPEPAGDTPEAAPHGAATSERDARLAAMAALRRRNDPNAIQRLWSALEDPEEDVRLLAHALLESKSRAVERRIHDLDQELKAAPPAGRASIHRRLAAENWELAWLGLSQGECLGHVLGMAKLHALAALEGEPGSAPLHFLLGRIELRLGEPHEATAALLRAGELGLPVALLQPYLAEAAFLARRFDVVRRRLSGAAAGETVDRIRRYWS